ncbi:MAG: TlpA family protein disulfide reductase [Bryobacterales bacterium]|nr:TlpA family protein disulfide reductase [Bryobacterales bacterium]
MRFLSAAVGALALFCASARLDAAGELSNRRAPGFSLPDSNINYHDLADYRGKIVLLDLIKTSCPVCNSSHKILETVRQKYPDKVTILTIVPAMEDNAGTVLQFVKANSVKTPMLFDCGQVMASYLKLTPKKSNIGLPHLFLIDANGMIRNDWEYVGGGTTSVFEALPPLLKEVEMLLNQQSGPVAPPKK